MKEILDKLFLKFSNSKRSFEEFSAELKQVNTFVSEAKDETEICVFQPPKNDISWKESETNKKLNELFDREKKKKKEDFISKEILSLLSKLSGVKKDEILKKTPKELNIFIKSLITLFPLKEEYNNLVSVENKINTNNTLQDRIREMMIDLSIRR